MSLRFDFQGRTVLVTGAAQGIGAEICARFLQAGADVWGSDLDAAALARSAEVVAGRLEEGDGPIIAGSSRVWRGGAWNNNATNCRSAYRNHNEPDNRNNNLGFRLARSV